MRIDQLNIANIIYNNPNYIIENLSSILNRFNTDYSSIKKGVLPENWNHTKDLMNSAKDFLPEQQIQFFYDYCSKAEKLEESHDTSYNTSSYDSLEHVIGSSGFMNRFNK